MTVKAILGMISAVVLVFTLAGCAKEEPTMADKVDSAADAVGDAARDAGDAVGDAADDAADAMSDAADDLEKKE